MLCESVTMTLENCLFCSLWSRHIKYVQPVVLLFQYGFINYEAEEGKKLFFHMTEVHDSAVIQPGDEVEFVLVQNQRNGKYSACSLRKIT